MLELAEAAIINLEEQIPEIAKLAFKTAYWDALMAGYSVTICENGVLQKIFPDGSREIIKKIEPPLKVAQGTIFIIPEKPRGQ